MKIKMNVQFNPDETPISEIERKLKFIDELPFSINSNNPNFKELRKEEELKKGFDIIFRRDNTVDIIPLGDVDIIYSDLDKLPNRENCKVGVDGYSLNIYDNTVNNPDTYCLFYKGGGK